MAVGGVCCGASGLWCPAGSTCTSDTCYGSCPSTCGAVCTDTQYDFNNCGSCGNVCEPATGGLMYCENGICKRACPSGSVLSSSSCVPATNTITTVTSAPSRMYTSSPSSSTSPSSLLQSASTSYSLVTETASSQNSVSPVLNLNENALSIGAIIGIGLAAAVAGILFTILAFSLWRRRSRSLLTQEKDPTILTPKGPVVLKRDPPSLGSASSQSRTFAPTQSPPPASQPPSSNTHKPDARISPHWYFVYLASASGKHDEDMVLYEGHPVVASSIHNPAVADEMYLLPGHLVQVRIVFRDGWTLAENLTTGSHGFCPVDCLSVGPSPPLSDASHSLAILPQAPLPSFTRPRQHSLGYPYGGHFPPSVTSSLSLAP
ncbi:hypothetical protein M427DRAFT_52810 [Gonapodya prolifera JEL478]|uniref:SH3 domain-containing protein n=1 Tax=Gonapodya prolifera (strain JEL478) TaxID=1344416 RepID=A0A139ARN3_GONPJ|nr:hypothetical protein M427DRAFT_52810 [Gonapodya prolifera JEL478]|eukprot:KXS19369.1 hypothetical protein M427DRAFT_52810 [Gonapodya prolifera JEL478]